MMESNGFVAFLNKNENDVLEIDITSPYYDHDTSQTEGDYLRFKMQINNLDIMRKARKENKKVYINLSYLQE